MLEIIKAFDWFLLIFILMVLVRMVTGFLQGGYRFLFKLAALLVGIGLAFALCKPIGGALYHSGLGDSMTLSIGNIMGSASPDMARELTKADLELMHTYWVAGGNTGTTQDMVYSMLHEGYGTILIPEALYNTLDSMIWANIPETGTFTFGNLVALAISQVGCIAIAFVLVAFTISFLGGIAVEIVYKAKKLAKKKPSVKSRVLGVSLGLVMGLFSIWTFSISAKAFLTAFPTLWEAFSISMQIDNPNYWSLSKFLFTWEFGYKDLFNWFLSFTNFQFN